MIEGLAEALAHELLADFATVPVTVTIRKPNAPIECTFARAGVEIDRRR